MWEVIGSLILIVALAAFADWYRRQTDDEEDVQINEMDLDLDDRIKELFDDSVDEDPYGELEMESQDSYRATLVNRGNHNKE